MKHSRKKLGRGNEAVYYQLCMSLYDGIKITDTMQLLRLLCGLLIHFSAGSIQHPTAFRVVDIEQRVYRTETLSLQVVGPLSREVPEQYSIESVRNNTCVRLC